MTKFGTIRNVCGHLVLVAVFLISPKGVAEPTPIDPANPYLILLKWVTQFNDLDPASKVLVVSMGVTLQSYIALSGAYSEARKNRTAAVNRLRELRLERADFERRMGPLNEALKRWEKVEEEARESLVELELKAKRLDEIPKNKRKRWLESDVGRRWQSEVVELNEKITSKLEIAYRDTVRSAQLLFPDFKKSVPIEAKEPERSPRESLRSDRLQSKGVRIDNMGEDAKWIRDQCRSSLVKFDTDISAAQSQARWRNHVNRRHLFWGTGTLAGIGTSVGTYGIYRYNYGKDPVELSQEAFKKNQAKLLAEIDLCGQVSSADGRKMLDKAFVSFSRTLKGMEPRISTDLLERLGESEKLQLEARGYSVDSLVQFLSKSEHVRFAFERAICQAGKKNIGENASVQQLLNYLYPKPGAIRDIQRPAFVHDLWVGFFNSVWVQLHRGGANRITEPVYVELETELLKALDHHDVVAPPATPTPGISAIESTRNQNSSPKNDLVSRTPPQASPSGE